MNMITGEDAMSGITIARRAGAGAAEAALRTARTGLAGEGSSAAVAAGCSAMAIFASYCSR